MKAETMITTIHGIERVKERCNFKNHNSALRNIGLALKRGKRIENYSSWERTYLINKAYDDCSAIAYNGFCYIVNETGRCVTVCKLPAWFDKKKHFDGKTRIRDYKKYNKYNLIYHQELS